jgi:hypothetical protein
MQFSCEWRWSLVADAPTQSTLEGFFLDSLLNHLLIIAWIPFLKCIINACGSKATCTKRTKVFCTIWLLRLVTKPSHEIEILLANEEHFWAKFSIFQWSDWVNFSVKYGAINWAYHNLNLSKPMNQNTKLWS